MRGEIRQKSKHKVSILNLDGFKEQVINFLTNTGQFNSKSIILPFYTYGLVEKNGKHCLINTEGVGCMTALEDERDTIAWHKHTLNEDGTTGIGIMPCAEMDLMYDELMAGAKIAKRVSLDKFIRLGGRRLEDNFDEWERFLSK
jgi:hypothetical protein